MQHKQQPEGKKKAALWGILFLALCGLGYAMASLLGMGRERLAAEALQGSLQSLGEKQVSISTAPSPKITQTPPSDTPAPRFTGWLAEYAREPDRTVDFAALRQVNGDIYAWLSVPGAGVEYPVAHVPKGDERYLTHDLEGKQSKYGAVFSDGYNHPDFSDPVTVLYGHNMKDGSMFAPLHRFSDAAFFEENRIIRVYIADYMLEYEIVAAYETDDTHILAAYDFTREEEYEAYLSSWDTLRDLRVQRWPRALTAKDRLLTLATCVQGNDHARYLVQGALKKP